MKYLVFNTEQEAIDAEAQICMDKGYPKVGVNAKTGLAEPDKQLTTRWAIPKQIADGRWVFESPSEEGTEADPTWWGEDA